MPVWQAVRPLGRALSVHQGKGLTADDAKLGALLEAVESHAAESFDEDGPVCTHDALPPDCRVRHIQDFAAGLSMTVLPERRRRWTETRLLSSGRPLFVPFDAVSLDFTRGLPSDVDRASNGVGTGANRAEAIGVALHELIERDAVTELRAGGLHAGTAATVLTGTVPFAWFGEWRDRLARRGITARVCRAPSITGTPVLTCELDQPSEPDAPYRAVYGQGAHPSPELALFKALAEAMQSRATWIAGAREDLAPSAYRARSGLAMVGMGMPLPAGMTGVDWRDIAPGPAGVPALVAALEDAGFMEVAVVDLARVGRFDVVRAFACGLGSLVRRRRRLSR